MVDASPAGSEGNAEQRAVRIDFESPANAGVLRFLGIAETAVARTTRPRGAELLTLGTHPDLVEHLWSLSADASCACVIGERGNPLLASPLSGVIFGLAGGTSTLALRLPEPELRLALAVPGYGPEYRYPSGTVRADALGEDWALVRPFSELNVEWCRRALAHAGTLG
jgi:hypothetical protein